MAYCCERELPSHSARASRSIVSPSTFFCIVPSNPMTLSQSGLSPGGLSTVNNALPVGGNFSGSLGITRPWSISASIVTHRICMIISRRCRNKSPNLETPYRGVATTLVSIRGHMSRRSFGEGGFVVSKNKNALPGISRQGALKSAYETLFQITPDSKPGLVGWGGCAVQPRVGWGSGVASIKLIIGVRWLRFLAVRSFLATKRRSLFI
jgi:hypothetical protein